jgi:hypothetical protein
MAPKMARFIYHATQHRTKEIHDGVWERYKSVVMNEVRNRRSPEKMAQHIKRLNLPGFAPTYA